METKKALEGVRVADFGWVWAAPYCTSLLGYLGAEVIKIESRKRVDQTRQGSILEAENYAGYDGAPPFNNANLNKKGVTIDLSVPEGAALARELVAHCDIAVANMRPGKMDKLHLGYEDLKKVRPDIIMLESTGFGSTGPYRHYSGFAPIFASFGGLANLTGYTDGAPNPMSGVQDLRAATQAAFSLLAALYHRKKTGEGQYIDCSSSECITALVGSEMMEYTMNGRSLGRTGNTDPVMAPHNVYRCKGEDKWVSIAVGTEEEWHSLVHAMGDPDWAKDEKFADMYSRHKNSGELDRHIAAWTIQFTHMEVMETLQSAGAAAMPSFCASEILENPHVLARNVVTSVEHPVLGKQYVLNPPWKLSETPATIRKSAPCMGENNEDVFMGLMGMSPERYQDLVDRKIIY